MKTVSVVIVSYHTGAALWLAIDSVLAQRECIELLLVNNGNVPGVEKRLEELAGKEPRFKLITGHGNVGFAKACNLGAKYATGDYILLLNPDSMLSEDALARAISGLERYPENTLAGCFLANTDGSEQRGSRRAILTPFNASIEALGLHRIFKSGRLNLHNTPAPASPCEVPAISGAFMLLARSFYNRLGGLDETYFLHMEDMDLCYRVHQKGGKVIFLPDVKVVHFRSTSEVASAFVERHKTRGFIHYLRTHFKDRHSSLFFAVLGMGIWLRYGLKVTVGIFDRLFVPPLTARQEIARLVLLFQLTRFKPQDTSLADKTIVITGASGQVGLCLVGRALAQGARVIALYNRTRIPFTHPNLTWVQADLAHIKASPVTHADILLHAAPLRLLPDIMPFFTNAGVGRIITLSSVNTEATAPRNDYEKKVVTELKAAEEEVMHLGSEHRSNITIVRTTSMYGVGLDKEITRLADVIRRFGALPIYPPAQGQRHPVQVQDIARYALDILGNPETYSKSYNLGGSQVMSYRTMLELLFQYQGKKPRLWRWSFLPSLLDALGATYNYPHINGEIARRMNIDLIFDIREAIDDFGYRPQGFLQGKVVL